MFQLLSLSARDASFCGYGGAFVCHLVFSDIKVEDFALSDGSFGLGEIWRFVGDGWFVELQTILRGLAGVMEGSGD